MKEMTDQWWKLVPVEPTEEMLLAAVDNSATIIREHYASTGKYTGTVSTLSTSMFAEIWKIMLAAAPPVPLKQTTEKEPKT